MKADLYCSHCEITYHVRWNLVDFDDGGRDPLDEQEGKEETYPEFCPFCGSSAEDEI
jgi:hypothetical protein